MVTNGTLLDERMIKGLLESRLNMLWISFDRIGEENFDGARSMIANSAVIKNLQLLNELSRKGIHRIEIGIAFVVTKLNVMDLPKLDRLALIIHATKISVSNILPYSGETAKLTLHESVLATNLFKKRPNAIKVSLPMLDHSVGTEK